MGRCPPAPRPPALERHSRSIKTLCALPDGRLASGSWDRTIRLWDVAAGAETARLEGHSNSVNALCALPDGRLASGSDDKTIRLWDVRTGEKDPDFSRRHLLIAMVRHPVTLPLDQLYPIVLSASSSLIWPAHQSPSDLLLVKIMEPSGPQRSAAAPGFSTIPWINEDFATAGHSSLEISIGAAIPDLFKCSIGARRIDRGDGTIAGPQGALNARWTRCRRFGFDSVEGHAASEKSKSE